LIYQVDKQAFKKAYIQAKLIKLERSLCTTLDTITFSMVTARDMAKRIWRSEHMNVILLYVAKLHSRH